MKKIICFAIVLVVCFGSTACSSNRSEDETVINPTKDKIVCLHTAVDESVSDGKKLFFKVKNKFDNTILFEDIVLLAYDKDLNLLPISSDNDAVELAPGEKSKKFNYQVKGDVEFIKIVGYKYSENGDTFVDTFETIEIIRGSHFISDANYYSDEEILNKKPEKDLDKKLSKYQ